MYIYESDIYNDEPLVVYLENFVAPSDCDSFIEYAKPKVKSSKVISKTNGTTYHHSARTSSDFFMPNDYEPNEVVRNNVAEFFDKDIISLEDSMIIRYQKGEQYKPHVDYFLHGVSGSKQRVATAICYLNDVDEGGKTVFPLLGLSFKPKKGSLIYFEYNYTPEINRLTTHAGEPITDNSEKWIMTIWMRDTGNGFKYDA